MNTNTGGKQIINKKNNRCIIIYERYDIGFQTVDKIVFCVHKIILINNRV